MITTSGQRDMLVLDQKPGAAAWFLAAFIVVWIYVSMNILRSGDNAGWIFLAAVIVPLFFLTFVERQTLELDRPSDSLCLTKRTVFKKRQIVDEVGAIQKAKTRWHGKGSTRMGRLVLLLDTGPMEFGSPQRKNRAHGLAREVNGWLDSKGLKA